MNERERDDQFLPDDLYEIAEQVRARRYDVDALKLDRLKVRAMAQASTSSRKRKGTFLRSRLVTMALVFGLALSMGAAGVIAGKNSPDRGKSAARSEYKCNAGNGNGPEPGPTGVSPDCDPGNSGDHNQDNEREGPGPGQSPPPPRNKK
jgi:hypothetical protein